METQGAGDGVPVLGLRDGAATGEESSAAHTSL
jgi:hypothetical protein